MTKWRRRQVLHVGGVSYLAPTETLVYLIWKLVPKLDRLKTVTPIGSVTLVTARLEHGNAAFQCSGFSSRVRLRKGLVVITFRESGLPLLGGVRGATPGATRQNRDCSDPDHSPCTPLCVGFAAFLPSCGYTGQWFFPSGRKESRSVRLQSQT